MLGAATLFTTMVLPAPELQFPILEGNVVSSGGAVMGRPYTGAGFHLCSFDSAGSRFEISENRSALTSGKLESAVEGACTSWSSVYVESYATDSVYDKWLSL